MTECLQHPWMERSLESDSNQLNIHKENLRISLEDEGGRESSGRGERGSRGVSRESAERAGDWQTLKKTSFGEISKDISGEREREGRREGRREEREHVFVKRDCMLWRCMSCCNRFW